jgi:hypothetical protein
MRKFLSGRPAPWNTRTGYWLFVLYLVLPGKRTVGEFFDDQCKAFGNYLSLRRPNGEQLLNELADAKDRDLTPTDDIKVKMTTKVYDEEDKK